MKNILAFLLLLCISLAIQVTAHSGRTDSNGGHYNRSTGEYHYHHGYSAHSHYDMDEDGMRDCPYTYVPKKETPIVKEEAPIVEEVKPTVSEIEEVETEDKEGQNYGALVVTGAVLTCAGYGLYKAKKHR